MKSNSSYFGYNPKDPDDFPYLVMNWLNNNDISSGGVFNTPHGILHVFWNHGWEYHYIIPQDLPVSFYEDKEN
jgi:hypothetical protein